MCPWLAAFVKTSALICFLSLMAPSGLHAQNAQPRRTYPGRFYTSVEKLAEFPGGRSAMLDFLAKHIDFPNSLDRIQYKPGPITVRFIVAPDGILHDITIDSQPVTNPDAEKGMDAYRISIIRAIEKMPRWQPALMEGAPVAMLYTLPLQVDN